VFSFKHGKFVTKMPERLRYPVTVTYGDPLPAETPVSTLRQKLMELGTEAWAERRADRRPLHHSFARVARRAPGGMAVQDGSGYRLSRIGLLASGVALARALREAWGESQKVGVLLPSCVGAASVNLAAALSGRVSVNLNFTTGEAAMHSAIRQASIQSVVTSRAFVEKLGLRFEDHVRLIWIEDLVESLRFSPRLFAFLLAAFAPLRRLERLCGSRRPVSLDDTATIIFSSGSTGEPKGVILSHYNLDSNVEAVAEVISAQVNDRLRGILPLFHSFGYFSIWYALNQGIGIVFHSNPLDAVTSLVKKERVTVLIATPTFLDLYRRRGEPGSFGSLRLVLSGAERLSPRVRNAFAERFGVRPLEG
jgi:acyl-[acyl-carrier-protein]-phospholipid O-acyltransferase/long-chain-fatty-acid--[acyl-carrier-protein] ligase